jgi:hypothetical protein
MAKDPISDMKKVCKGCLTSKPIDSFYKNKTIKSGISGKCKECIKSYSKNHRIENPDYYKSYAKATRMKPEYVQKRKDWSLSGKGKALRKRQNEHQNFIFPERQKARWDLRNAVRDGRVKRFPCFICGNEKVDGHHYDYSKPFDVTWLCRKHHRAAHEVSL